MTRLSDAQIKPIRGCRACGNSVLLPIMDLGWQALTGRFQKPGDPDLPSAPLEVVLCHGEVGKTCCGLLQLRHSCDPGEMFGSTYGYRSSMNQTMVNHLRLKIERLLALTGAGAGDRVLDIGANDGTLLRNYDKASVQRFGIDPSSGQFAAEYPSDITLIVDFFAAERVRPHAGKGFKIITSLAMFYDLETPQEFMHEIRSVLAPDGVWEFEQSYMPGMLDRLSYDTMCHEHLSYFGMKQILWMTERAGLKVLDVELNDINGGSFAILAARADSSYVPNRSKIDLLMTKEFASNLGNPEPYRAFARKSAEHRDEVRALFDQYRRNDKMILGYGASTKGNVILQYCNLTPRDMPAIAEKHPGKIGLLAPGTRIPIISEQEARSMRPDALMVLPWHFKTEIIERESAFLNAGGNLLFPLPELHSVAANKVETNHLADTKPAAKIPWARPVLFGNETSFVHDAIESTMLSEGPYVKRLESDFAHLHGMEAACGIAVSNGTTAIYLALLALNIGPGDEVIVPGWGFAAAANMVLTCGAKPVFADVLPDTWLLDPASVESMITPRTRAIIPIHTYGVICDMPALCALAKKHGLVVIEDCAEAPFSRLDGQLAGTWGDIACFSFQSTKTLTCGEGGFLLVRDAELAQRMRLIRSHGMEAGRKYWHLVVGHNFRLTNMQAAVLCAQILHLKEIVDMRERVYSGYRNGLAHVPGIRFQHVPDGMQPVMWALGIRLEQASLRDALASGLATCGIETRPAFHAFSEQPLYQTPRLTNAAKVASHVLTLPFPADLSTTELNLICRAVSELLSGDRQTSTLTSARLVTQ